MASNRHSRLLFARFASREVALSAREVEDVQLSRFSDLALRLLMYLGTRDVGQWATVREASEAFDVSMHHMAKVAQWLTQRGFVSSRRGRGGGLRLEVDPRTIGIGAILRDANSATALVECFDPETDHCRISGACRLRDHLERAREAFFSVLDGVTLADLLHRPASLVHLLPVPPRAGG